MRGLSTALSLAVIAVPSVSAAQQRSAPQLIAARDYVAAERVLESDRKMFPQEPELLLNLAAVYQYTGRADQARALYQQILAQPDVLMDQTGERSAWSHAIAQVGLRRINGVQMTSR